MTTPLWSDNPSALDLLGFADVTAPITEALLRDKLDPVTVGIEGDWGSGKTSMLRLLAYELGQDPSVVVVETHPWEYDPATDPKATLIAEVLGQVHAAAKRDGDMAPAVREKFKALAKRVRVSKAVKLAVNTALSGGLPRIADVLDLFNDEAETVPDPTLKGFREEFTELMAMDELKDIQRVVVLVDDLDRCLPETVIATLEAVKLFLSVPKMAFVMAADRRAVAHAVATRYEPSPQALELGREYLEKIVHIPVPVPALGESDTRAYLALLMLQRHIDDDALATYISRCDERRTAGETDVLKGLPQDGLSTDATNDLQLAAMLAPVLYERLHGNPRKLKRFLNAYWMRATVARRRGIELQPHALAKLMVLEELEGTAFRAVLGWLRAGNLSEQLQALEAGKTPTGAGEAVLAALKHWASIAPALAELESLESYLRLAASLRSQVGAEAGLRADVKALVEPLLSPRQAERRAGLKELPSAPQDVRLLAVEYLLKRIRSNPDEQGKLAPALSRFAEDPAVAEAMVGGLSELSPERIEAALVIALLPKKIQPLMREVVQKWLDSGGMEAGAAEIARKNLSDAETGS